MILLGWWCVVSLVAALVATHCANRRARRADIRAWAAWGVFLTLSSAFAVGLSL